MQSQTAHQAKTAEEVLQWAAGRFAPGRVALASSFGLEDMVLIDMIARHHAGIIHVFTLDTGRLHEETYEIMDRARNKYKNLVIKTYFPDRAAVEKLVREKGFYSFRESLDNRKECCHIRKVEPLKRALSELDGWITGLRREQSPTRAEVDKIAEDKDHPPLIKLNPLADWTLDQVAHYLESNKVPTNALHKRNYPSIGCSPCTRPVQPGEDVRAGRWWWENPDHKECGLHRPR